MNSNISRDHIAMEAMKVLLKASVIDATPWWKRLLWPFGKKEKIVFCGNPDRIAGSAYRIADSMIKVRENGYGE